MGKRPRIRPQSRKTSRNAGAFRGSLSSWRAPQTYSIDMQAREREISQERASDLAVNDWAASSALNAITTNTVGTGLKPQSRIDYKRLGISKEEASELQHDIEQVWKDWSIEACADGMLNFEDLQFLGLRTMVRMGELIHLPVMIKDSNRKIKLAIQNINPNRLLTPFEQRHTTKIVDGIELGKYGEPIAYWIATPKAVDSYWIDYSTLASSSFTRVPKKIGHRPNCFHLFRKIEDEQMRGESIFTPGMNLFRHLSDSLDNELLAQVITASMALFISKETNSNLPDYLEEELDRNGNIIHHENIIPGSVLYGNMDEKPHVLESSRPSPNFASFSEFVLRAMAASVDMPYEVVAKDFSKTNYSSARAALLEAWRVYLLYRTWLVNHYCKPIWSMVMEEAWLSGILKFPASAPDFYDAKSLYIQSSWIGPSRGYIDPVKEANATAIALDKRLMSYSEALAERGYDFEELMEIREVEEEALRNLDNKNISKEFSNDTEFNK